MNKYGDGLNIEFVRAVKQGLVQQPFCTDDVRAFAHSKGWNPSEHYVQVLLANGASQLHSLTYKKYFKSLGDGQYTLSELASEVE